MTKWLVASIAALFLATGAAHATEIYSIRCANQLLPPTAIMAMSSLAEKPVAASFCQNVCFVSAVTALGSFAVTDANM